MAPNRAAQTRRLEGSVRPLMASPSCSPLSTSYTGSFGIFATQQPPGFYLSSRILLSLLYPAGVFSQSRPAP